MRQVERLWLRPSLNEVFDLEWSPCGAYVVIGALEGKAEVIRIATRDSLFLPGHTSYVQGVTWDPLNKMIGTESSDRSCRLHMIKYKDSSMVKVAPRGHCVLKMHGGYTSGSGTDATADAATTNAEDDNNAGNLSGGKTQGINMFMDSNVPSFFRRLSFTPDGALLIVPTGIHRNPNSVSTKNKANVNAKSYCTHIFHRDQLLNNTCSMPALSLIGLDDPSVAIRVNPRLFKHVTSANNPDAISLFRGDYR